MHRNDDTHQMKYEVLREVAQGAFDNDLSHERLESIPFKLIPTATPRFRCCVYKEREIVRQHVKLATGKAPIPPHNVEHRIIDDNIIQVVPAACEGCPIKRFQVTENCQRCMAKACQKACNFDAISITARGAFIDQDKCRECGKCAAACPYNAITDLIRPCKRACDVDAITIGHDKLATINMEKCISCGHCAAACPFGAISDLSQITEVIKRLRDPYTNAIAIPAPAIEGQFGGEATIGKVKTALLELGFNEVFEVALGGDAVAYNEAKELIEAINSDEKMTTSCCPAFVTLIKKHYPSLAEKMSKTVSPMVATVRWIRKHYKGAYVVFIGPCMAKKAEARFDVEGNPDAVLTFEELNAIFDAKGIDPVKCEESETQATSFGRGFSASGGVSNAIIKAAKELGYSEKITPRPCNGAKECKIALQMLKVGKLPEDIIEGMICEGGCIAGPGSLSDLNKLKQSRLKKIKGFEDDSISDMLSSQDFMEIDMER